MRRLFLTMAATAGLAATGSATADQEATLPDTLDIANFPGVVIEDVVVPNPGEIFWLMDKLGQPDWASRVRKNFDLETTVDRTDKALTFGALIADGFIAVQAEAPDAVREIGREILKLAEALSLRNEVFPHTQAILEATDNQDWNQVREELDRTNMTVRTEMERYQDGDLAQCVSMAGWLRGTQVLTDLIIEAYSTDKAEILNQPDLASHFITQVEAMAPKIAEHGPVKESLAGLKQVRDIMASHPDGIPSTSVEKIHVICSDIMKIILPSDA